MPTPDTTQKLHRIELSRVQYVPRQPEPGILYVSEKYGAAVHLCACGCRAKVSTPLSQTGWKLVETPLGATLTPSVGNWQLPCRSHYWIRDGKILWSGDWSDAQISAGRRAEEERRREYFAARTPGRTRIFRRIWEWLVGFFG